ncbi:MAG: copper amine oxidase [Clostridium sp.]|nr:copper amine oxidase [Clostridium sp.]
MKKFICLFMLIVILCAYPVLPIEAKSNIGIIVDDVKIVFDAEPHIDGNSRTMVPIRFVSEALFADVGWDGIKKKVTISKDNTQILLTIGQKSATVNGKHFELDSAPVIVQDRTFVPLRFIGDAFKAAVEWDDKNRLVKISTKPAIPQDGYYNELYNLFTMVPKHLTAAPINQKAFYKFNKNGTVSFLDYTPLHNLNDIPPALYPSGIIFSPKNYDSAESFVIEIFKDVNRTPEQLIGQYIHFSDLKSYDLITVNKNDFSFVTTKGFDAFDVKEIGYKLKSRKLLAYCENNVYVFTFVFDPQNPKYLTDKIMWDIVNSIEINGNKINLNESPPYGNYGGSELNIQLVKPTYTKRFSSKQNEERVKEKYLPHGSFLSQMVRIDGGNFIDDDGSTIFIEPFYVSENLVSIAEWNKYSIDKININQYNTKYGVNIKSEQYPAVFETVKRYGAVNIKDSLPLFKFCNALSKNHGFNEYYSFVEDKHGTSTLFEHNNGFRLPSEYELKYILRRTKNEPFKDTVISNTLLPVATSGKNLFGIFDFNSNAAEATDFDYVFKIKDVNQMLCGFRYAKSCDNPMEQLIIDFFDTSGN